MPAESFKELMANLETKKCKIIYDTGGKIYIENQGTLVKYSESEITFRTKEQEITISGVGLYLEMIGSDYVHIKGRISNIALKGRSA